MIWIKFSAYSVPTVNSVRSPRFVGDTTSRGWLNAAYRYSVHLLSVANAARRILLAVDFERLIGASTSLSKLSKVI